MDHLEEDFGELNLNKKGKYRKADRITPQLSREVWSFYNGRQWDGKCYVCDEKLEDRNAESGHVISKAHGGEAVFGNLRPVCRTCNGNRGMGQAHMIEYMLHNNTPGKKNLVFDDPEVKRIADFMSRTTLAILHLENLEWPSRVKESYIRKLKQIDRPIAERQALINQILPRCD